MSTFAELFSDFQDQAKEYAEKLDVTELSFMRMLTRGMQRFQRETELLYGARVLITKQATGPPWFILPNDIFRPIAVYDSDDRELLLNTYVQYDRNINKYQANWGGYRETPNDYDIRIYPDKESTPTRLCTTYNNELLFYPDNDDQEFKLYYVPDVQAISSVSAQWAAWFPIDTNFIAQFIATGPHFLLAPYEDAFVKYALAEFIKGKRNPNYKVYMDDFKNEVLRAKEEKPYIGKEALTSYFLAPWS